MQDNSDNKIKEYPYLQEVMIGNKPYFIEHKVLQDSRLLNYSTDIEITIYKAKTEFTPDKGFTNYPDTSCWEDRLIIKI